MRRRNLLGEKIEKTNKSLGGNKFVSLYDLKILTLEIEAKFLEAKIELEKKINGVVIKVGTLVVSCSGILFTLLSIFHK